MFCVGKHFRYHEADGISDANDDPSKKEVFDEELNRISE